MQEIGKVYLIGAGPGDPGLITERGASLLKKADAVIYDDLINPVLLAKCPKDCVMVYVGKKGGKPSLKQSTINETLIALASEHEHVIRLKGGDPMIFGRAFEECMTLKQNGVDIEIIPGITSAIGCAAYSGIPLTDRKYSSSIAFVTAKKAQNAVHGAKYWVDLLQAVDTVCVYMGFAKLEEITSQIKKSKRLCHLPAAVIQYGTLTAQASIKGNVSNICELVKEAKLVAPVMLILGKTVELSNDLNWFENKPLFKTRIVVTRSAQQSNELVSGLQSLGAHVMNLPTIHMRPPVDFTSLDDAIKKIDDFDWLLFTSANAVQYFFERLNGKFKTDSRLLFSNKIAAIGPQTSKTLRNYGLKTDLLAQPHTTDGVIEAFESMRKGLKGSKVLLIRPENAPMQMPSRLAKVFDVVKTAHSYRNAKATQRIIKSLQYIQDQTPDMITFTSASTVRHLISSLGKKNVLAWLKGATCVSIGPMTTAAIKDCGLSPIVQSKESSITSMIDAIKDMKAINK